jgi:hypothetical protein
MGSVAEKVLARAPCPVLILPSRAGEGVRVGAKIPNSERVFVPGETNHVTRNILRWTVECPITGNLAKAEIATTPGSVAMAAGVQRGDIITKANDQSISSAHELEAFVRWDPQSTVRFFEITDCSLWAEKGCCEQNCINRPTVTAE